MILRSGKYKGQLISEVQQYDPGYIRWCKENTPWMLKQPKEWNVFGGVDETFKYINNLFEEYNVNLEEIIE